MLIVPFLFGMFAARPGWLHALLFFGWLLVYLFSFAFLQWIRTKKKPIYVRPMQIYGSLLVPAGILLFILKPSLGWFVPLFIPLFFVNCYYAKRNQERAFINDVAAVVQFSLMVFVAYHAGGGSDWRLAAELFAISILYYVGTVFYVKTIIREKNNPKYYWFSVGYHLALLAAGVLWFHPWLALPLTVLALRAALSPRMKLTVKQSGMLEIVYSVLITITVLIVYTT
jgi:hypothetical protein